MEMIAPFGPVIGKVILEDWIYDALIKITDEELKNPERVNAGASLAGHIKEQINLPTSKLENEKVTEYFYQAVDFYMRFISNDYKGKLRIGDTWCNYMYKSEWNPSHVHNGFISTIIVLKVPQLLPEEGEITFTNNSSRVGHELEQGMLYATPKEKDFYIFPARLNHSVSPFTSEGERRTVSFNVFWHPE